MHLPTLIETAWRARAPLRETAELDAYRLFHGWGEGYPGLGIDRYGSLATIEYRTHVKEQLDDIADAVLALHPFTAVVARPKRGRPQVLRGHLSEQPVRASEYGLRYLIDALRPGNPGLYLDARPARAWLREHSRDRRVMNLFAFTGSLGIAAAAGGARVLHVDSAKRSLAVCRDNHALNELRIDERDLMRVNIYQHLRRKATERQRFGGIIIDPPPLSGLALRSDRTPGERGVFGLAPVAARMLEPGGWLLCLFHHDERPHQALEAALVGACEIALEPIWRATSGADFPEPDPQRKLRLSAFARVA
ncbi:class I SAM-dependent methyltransferase [Haliangium ochraceum]|uniref:S-adenosylmethionine-dependent methyltransferase domain-containing protein n=1 Tax=Haliangium ochraceum (strain DSM 14365 / JCM 11303 / SMP-2) TaxID=502025 RepID=D0LHU2_HALO1|nr:class I SAM-dependent methyltransferase [Haliangium ochraceum]ACY14771.1 conserved hypothetical protein [Haliangium ochraceum DSM 14365]